MTVVSVRKQGGAAIITIPSDVLKSLGIDVGTELDVAVVDGVLTARPKRKAARKRYSMRQLLRGATPRAMRALTDDIGWAQEGDAVGREL